MKLGDNERRLDGNWVLRNGRMVADAVCSRIDELIATHLEEVATDASGWEKLYRDPDDGRYWERTYPHGEMHGGGPPALVLLSIDEAIAKYRVTI